jgi:hypothetical protein
MFPYSHLNQDYKRIQPKHNYRKTKILLFSILGPDVGYCYAFHGSCSPSVHPLQVVVHGELLIRRPIVRSEDKASLNEQREDQERA